MKRRGEAAPEPEATPAPVRTPVPDNAPYDPVTVPVRALAEALAEIDDVETIEALQTADPRSSADQHYQARIAELDGG